jgi:hypothetical protein
MNAAGRFVSATFLFMDPRSEVGDDIQGHCGDVQGLKDAQGEWVYLRWLNSRL